MEVKMQTKSLPFVGAALNKFAANVATILCHPVYTYMCIIQTSLVVPLGSC